MRVTTVKLIIIVLWVVSLTAARDIATSTERTPAQPTSATPIPAAAPGIKDVIVDKDKVFYPCPVRETSCTEDKARIHIKAFANLPAGEKPTFYYLVSGGTIIGEGAEVIWDFSKSPAGPYTVTVALGVGGVLRGVGGVLRGTTITKTVQVDDCPICDFGCSCPTLSISAPTGRVKVNDTFVMRANVEGGKDNTYAWKVTAGKIIGSPNGSQVLVKATPDTAGKQIEATVHIGGTDLACNCTTTASEFVTIAK
jgi:hypothetical protein